MLAAAELYHKLASSVPREILLSCVQYVLFYVRESEMVTFKMRIPIAMPCGHCRFQILSSLPDGVLDLVLDQINSIN